MKQLIISGACGRMGRMIAQEAADKGFEVAAGVDRAGEAYASFPLFPHFDSLPAADVLIDFSSPSNLLVVVFFNDLNIKARQHVPGRLCVEDACQTGRRHAAGL